MAGGGREWMGDAIVRRSRAGDGGVKQVHVQPDPQRMAALGVTLVLPVRLPVVLRVGGAAFHRHSLAFNNGNSTTFDVLTRRITGRTASKAGRAVKDDPLPTVVALAGFAPQHLDPAPHAGREMTLWCNARHASVLSEQGEMTCLTVLNSWPLATPSTTAPMTRR